jgi:hypothetical protein
MALFTVVRRHDGLAGEYARKMGYFDCRTGIFQLITGGDITPPCVGYHGSKADWNSVSRRVGMVERH